MTNSNSNDKYIIVYKMTLAIELMKRGHKAIATMPNPNKPGFTSWVFEKSENFLQDLKELKGGRRNGTK